MNVIPVLVICSLFLALCAVALFVWSANRGDHDHVDRLSLMPLEDDIVEDLVTENETAKKT